MNEVIENKTKGELEEEKTVKRKDKWKIEKRGYEKWNEKIEIDISRVETEIENKGIKQSFLTTKNEIKTLRLNGIKVQKNDHSISFIKTIKE